MKHNDIPESLRVDGEAAMSRTLLTEEQVADILRISKRALQDLCRAGRIGYVRVTPRQRAFLPEHVEHYIHSRTITPPKRIDTPRGKRLPSTRKGGDTRKSSGDVTRAQLRKELAQWR